MKAITAGVKLTRENFDDLAIRAALSCARGVRQVQVVRAIIEDGYVTRTYEKHPVARDADKPLAPREKDHVAYNGSLSRDSWNNMKRRLEITGFEFETLVVTYETARIYMSYKGRES